MSSPGFLAVGGVEIANNARTVAYLSRGLGGPWFQTVQSQVCPDLLQEVFPLAVCATGLATDQLYNDPRSTYRVPTTGAVPTNTGLRWDAAGWEMGVGQTTVTGAGFVIPNQNVVPLRMRLVVDVLATPAATRQFEVARPINVGTANVAWLGASLRWNGSNWILGVSGRTLAGNSGVTTITTIGASLLGQYTLQVDFTAQGFTSRLYGGDPDTGSPLIATAAYGYSADTSGTWYTDMGVTEVASFAAVTEASVVSFSSSFPLTTEMVISEVGVFPTPCTQDAGADLFPSDTLWPSDDLYPGLYGAFLDPGTDSAPWVDVDRPEGYGYLGLLVDDIKGLDTTSDRSVDPAADGIGGILGPETLAARQVTVSGWLIATDCSAMEYARRWLAETLAASLCAGCDLAFMDVRTTCGDDPAGDFYTNRWRLYDCGLTGMTTDTSNQEMCCFVTPIEFTITAGDPYLYGPALTVSGPTALNPGGADAPPVPFETWLFQQGTATCLTVADQGIGIDAPIFTFNGGTSGIEAGLAYPSRGVYPSDSIWPGDCLFPADGSTQWSMDDCPFAFTFSIGPGETFVIDNARRQLVWTLANGTVLDGSPRMQMDPGDVISWIDTCNGASIDACVSAFATCSCDATATVTIQTQHRER